MISLFKGKKIKASKGRSFFDYSAKEQKKLIKNAAKEANELQLKLVKKYAKAYADN